MSAVVASRSRWRYTSLQRRSFPLLMVAPALVLIAAVVLYPIGYAGWLAFHFWDIRRDTTTYVGLDHFRRLVDDSIFWQSFRNTLAYVVMAVTVEFFAGFGLALILHNRFRGVSVIRSIIMLPMFVVPVVVGLTWRLLYNQDYGPIYYALKSAGLTVADSPFGLTNPSLALPLIALTSTWQVMPFVFLVLVAGMQSIPADQYEAARLDGANAFQEFRAITLPWLKPLILFVLLFRFMDSIKVFDLVIMLTNGGPGSTTEVASLYVYRQAFTYFNVGYASALAMVLLVVILAISLVLITVMRVEKNV